MTRVFRQLDHLRQLQEQTNDVTDARQSVIVDALAQRILLPGDVLTFDQTRDEAVLFTSGIFPGFTVASVHADIRGVPGAVVDGLVRIQTSCTIENLHFKSTGNENNAQVLVQVEAGGLAIFKNCTFERKNTDLSSFVDATAHLRVLEGGKARAFNCTFRSQATDGAMPAGGPYALSDLPNPIGNLDVVSSYNPTTQPIANGTETAVVT